MNDSSSELLHRTSGSLARQTVLVVGVTGFIGAAVACRLHAAGARVIGVSRSPPKSAVPIRHVRLDIARATDPASAEPLDVFAVGDGLAARGWYHDRQGPPDSLHSTVSNGNADSIEAWVTDLEAVAVEVRGRRAEDRSTSYATLE